MKELIEGPLHFHLLVSTGFRFMEIEPKLNKVLSARIAKYHILVKST